MNISHAINKATNLLDGLKAEGKILSYYIEPKVFVTIGKQVEPLSLLEISFKMEFPGEDPDDIYQIYYLTFLPSYDLERILKTAINGIYWEEFEKEQARNLERKESALNEE
jgi:hypothetical protein